jgi:hypothetical protein
LRVLGYIFAAILAVAMAIGLVYGGLLVFAPARLMEQDIRRNVTIHSLGYIQGKIQLLNGLVTDYNDPDATDGQKQAIVNEYCYQVTLLLPEERPANIIRFQAAHC